MQNKPGRLTGRRNFIGIVLCIFVVLSAAGLYLYRAFPTAAGVPSTDPGAPQNAAAQTQASGTEPDPEAGQGQASVDVRTPAPEPEPEPPVLRVTAPPVRMRIPALSVDADIEATGYDDTETMMIVPSADILSWLQEGPIPGNAGNAILGGHNRWKGTEGQLLYLDELQIGDGMEIDYADGTGLRFRLESVFVYPLATADADTIMDLEGEARVTVITCKDPYNPATGTSDNRIIAIFKEESDFVFPDPPIEPFPLLTEEELMLRNEEQ